MRSSRRIPPHETNALTRALVARRAAGRPVLDLTSSNATDAGITYPTGLLAPLADPEALRYEPRSFGLAGARQAVAADYARRGAAVDPARVVLTSSSSEAYAWLFKVLCDPGEAVLVPRPSYPLFEHLTRLEGVRAVPYDLAWHGRWEIDHATVDVAPAGVRAVVAVSPNNPTGSFVSPPEFERLSDTCAARGWPLVVDEVFADYALDGLRHATDQGLAAGRALTFTLGGCSKTLGLPQVKLGWIVAGGPTAEVNDALAALELVADSYLSVATPVQHAAARLLVGAVSVRDAIRARTRAALAAAREVVAGVGACSLLPVEGGWTAVVRVPATRGEERLVLDALEQDGVLVHPGYFFDFPHEAFVVVSLLTDPEAMR
jgi:aspartate/methionine/tyrosine aminotransferase